MMSGNVLISFENLSLFVKRKEPRFHVISHIQSFQRIHPHVAANNSSWCHLQCRRSHLGAGRDCITKNLMFNAGIKWWHMTQKQSLEWEKSCHQQNSVGWTLAKLSKNRFKYGIIWSKYGTRNSKSLFFYSKYTNDINK